jgi:hypothetical protein
MTIGGGPGLWEENTTIAPFRSLGLLGNSEGMLIPQKQVVPVSVSRQMQAAKNAYTFG